jgi:hypothetical protein
LQGIQEHWNLSAECGNGSFTNINSDAKPEDIPTPYDSTLITLNYKLNGTYMFYGERGAEGYALQGKVDGLNIQANTSTGIARITTKADNKAYFNSNWDLVDAKKEDKEILKKIDIKTLPDSLRNKSKAQIDSIITQRSAERINIQNEIKDISSKREAFLIEEKTKRAKNTDPTLETEIEKMIRTQATRFNMKIE